MANQQKKSNTVGRFGARYGVRIRRRVRDIESRQRRKHMCPSCGHEKVKREAAGIWRCRKCDHKFSGGAYVPETPGFKASQRQLEEALAEDEEDDLQDEGGAGVASEDDVVVPGEGPTEDADAGEDLDEPAPEEALDDADDAPDDPAPEELIPQEDVDEPAPEEALDDDEPSDKEA